MSLCPECRTVGAHSAGCPAAPESPPWDELTDAEKKAELATLDRNELVQMVLSHEADAEMWQARYRRLRRAYVGDEV